MSCQSSDGRGCSIFVCWGEWLVGVVWMVCLVWVYRNELTGSLEPKIGEKSNTDGDVPILISAP